MSWWNRAIDALHTNNVVFWAKSTFESNWAPMHVCVMFILKSMLVSYTKKWFDDWKWKKKKKTKIFSLSNWLLTGNTLGQWKLYMFASLIRHWTCRATVDGRWNKWKTTRFVCEFRSYSRLLNKMFIHSLSVGTEMIVYARNKHTPPAALMRSSAFFEKYLAFTMIGCLGMCPRPNNL